MSTEYTVGKRTCVNCNAYSELVIHDDKQARTLFVAGACAVADTEMTTVVLIAAAHAERHYVVTTLEQPHNSCCKNCKHVTRK